MSNHNRQHRPEQTQETAQVQTTETNVQPEQGTVETEQGVSIDLTKAGK